MTDENGIQQSAGVLVVEDSEDDALLLVDSLERAGFSIRWRRVETAEQLESALHEDRWDVVVSDYTMPRFSGSAALHIIQEFDPDIPFIFVSGTIGEDTAVAAMRAGAQDYVMKSNLARLAPAIRRELIEAEHRRARRRAEDTLRRLSQVVEQAADSVFITDPNGAIEYANPAFERLTGYSAEEVRGRNPAILKSGVHDPPYYREMWRTVLRKQVFRGLLINRRRDGELFYEDKIITPLLDDKGRIAHFVSTGRDITERKQFERQLRHWATHDALTGLPNRVRMTEILETALEAARGSGGMVGVFTLDVDNFKRVNVSLGHPSGDRLLREIAQRLMGCLERSQAVGRHGGDEFLVVAAGARSIDDVVRVLNTVKEACDAPIRVDGQDVFFSFSVGVAVYPPDGGNCETLLRNADTALHRAKSVGRGEHQFYAPDMNARAEELLWLEADLRRALGRGEFVFHYQPQVDFWTRRIESVEALLRWQHPDRGLMSPDEFVPLLEETGMIVSLGEWTLQRACHDWRIWQAAGKGPARIAVNVAARQFSDPAFVDMVRRALADQQVPARALELEITEQTVMTDVQQAGVTLEMLDALGVRLAVDDFGTGYSSLAYLKRFPLDSLKIDRTFVGDLPENTSDGAIVEASITLGHKLGLEVVAEGVETAQQFAFLRNANCDLAQGYYVSRPVPASDLAQLLAGG
ncbi:MAG: EAL domain-containing protein [Gammaproteobacteria bacterium]